MPGGILSAPSNVLSKYSTLVESGDFCSWTALTERHTGGSAVFLTNIGVGKPGGDDKGRTLTWVTVGGGED